jgi:asparagine synthase (glutamine-hydrolysing)
MSGLCGWFAGAAEPRSGHELPAIAQRQGTQLTGQGAARVLIATPIMGLIARDAAAALSRDGTLAVGIEGEPRLDSSLQPLAASTSTAQAVLEAYRQHGANVLRLIGGDFALVILDSAQRQAVAAIDRMGIRSFYHATTVAGLVFGSNASTIIAHPWIEPRLEPQALFDYIYLHVIAAPRTIYSGVSKLPLAHSMHHQDGRTRIEQYWAPSFSTEHPSDPRELQAELRSTLQTAVERAIEGKTTGSFLSGGLDSSTVTGFAARSTRLQHAYTIGFHQAGYDESWYAKLAAAHFAADLRLYYLQPQDVAASIGDIAAAYDEPFGNSSAMPTLACARNAAKDGIQTMLAGDGGDELFAGNERYAKDKVFEYYDSVPRWLRSVIEPVAYGLGSRSERSPLWKLYRYVDQAKQPARTRLLDVFCHLKGMRADFIFEPHWYQRIDPELPGRELQQTFDTAPGEHTLDRMLYLDWKITLADNDLRKVNRMCELGGVRVRYPMLDENLVELSTRVPPALKLRGLKLRDFYKRAFADFLPREIIHKRKHGFGLPFGEWLRTEPSLRELTQQSLQSLQQRGIFRAQCIEQLLRSHQEDHAAYFGSMVWALVMLELWLQHHPLLPAG